MFNIFSTSGCIFAAARGIVFECLLNMVASTVFPKPSENSYLLYLKLWQFLVLPDMIKMRKKH